MFTGKRNRTNNFDQVLLMKSFAFLFYTDVYFQLPRRLATQTNLCVCFFDGLESTLRLGCLSYETLVVGIVFVGKRNDTSSQIGAE